MTITTIYNATNLGGTTETLTGSPTKTVLQAGTTAVILNVRIISKTDQPNQSTMVRLWYCISPFVLTADGTLPTILKPTSGVLEVKLPQTGNSSVVDTTGILANNGGNLYTWFDSPALAQDSSTAPTLTLASTELP